MKRLFAICALVALFAFGDIAGPTDTSVFGAYRLDLTSIA